jgi:hypothetical protein
VRIYLAARYKDHPLMRRYRGALTERGHVVTSRWIDMHGGDAPDPVEAGTLNTEPLDPAVARYARTDLQDILAAQCLICFSYAGTASTGGAYVEFGVGLAVVERVILVGPRENVLHGDPRVEHYKTWDECLAALTPIVEVMYDDEPATDDDLPGMWSKTDYLGGDPDERSYTERGWS